MNDIEMFEAMKQLRPDHVADYIRTTRELAATLKNALPGDDGVRLRDRMLASPVYKAMDTYAETLSIEGWDRRAELLDSWDGCRGVEVVRLHNGLQYVGVLEVVEYADDEYKGYVVHDSEGKFGFAFGQIQEASVNPDGRRFIILG